MWGIRRVNTSSISSASAPGTRLSESPGTHNYRCYYRLGCGGERREGGRRGRGTASYIWLQFVSSQPISLQWRGRPLALCLVSDYWNYEDSDILSFSLSLSLSISLSLSLYLSLSLSLYLSISLSLSFSLSLSLSPYKVLSPVESWLTPTH